MVNAVAKSLIAGMDPIKQINSMLEKGNSKEQVLAAMEAQLHDVESLYGKVDKSGKAFEDNKLDDRLDRFVAAYEVSTGEDVKGYGLKPTDIKDIREQSPDLGVNR